MEVPDAGEQMSTYDTLAEMIHRDMTRGIVTEKGRETAETGAATATRIVKGVELVPGNAEGGPEAVKRRKGNVAEKRVEIRIKIKIRTESVSVGVVVGTGKGIETVTGKRKMSALKETLKILRSLLLKNCLQVIQAWMASR